MLAKDIMYEQKSLIYSDLTHGHSVFIHYNENLLMRTKSVKYNSTKLQGLPLKSFQE